jgi:triosephosphate isomerase
MERNYMRKPFVAGNWKMNKTVGEATLLVAEMLPGLEAVKTVKSVVCPPYSSLNVLSGMLTGTDIGLGAQNLHWESGGAYTGELSPAMIKEFCQYVIIGHSERRLYFGETDETVNKKVNAALENGLIPIVCVGETLAENEAGRTEEVVSGQVLKAFEGVAAENSPELIVAYEPIWAIGTGKAASGEGANDIIGNVVRKSLEKLFGSENSQKVRILYGGSVKPNNATEFFSQSDIDGGLIGGASLKAEDFVQIVEAAA